MPKLQSSPFQKHHFIFSLACGSFFVSPAYAGKRLLLISLVNCTRDHPRVCGEKLARLYSSVPVPGSPPRMRGKGYCAAWPRPASGITPACAGKSLAANVPGQIPRDHPRVCGEKLARLYSSVPVPGSPPRVRGKDTGIECHGVAHRITPAYAGKRERATSVSCL